MYILPFIKGLGLGLGMIIPIGAQNAYLINQGIRRNFHLLAALVCIFCDIFLIGFGIFGAGELISRNTLLLQLITMAGILFLSWYGFASFSRGIKDGQTIDVTTQSSTLTKSKRSVLIGALAVTLLNPHAYLDTVVILGSIGYQMDQELRIAFAMGVFCASVIWFLSLTAAAVKLAPWLSKPPVQRTIDMVIGVVMWGIALSLINRLL